MVEYDDIRAYSVARSCRSFSPDKGMNSRLNAAVEGVSCRVCKNWDGAKCFTNSFDGLIRGTEGDL